MARFPFLDWPAPKAFAHRGAHGGSGPAENTMAAFEAAVALGYRYVETDVHATSDGVLVAFHDHRLDRLTDGAGRIADRPWAEVGQARTRDGGGIPLLEEVLGTWPELRVNVDAKHDAAVEPLVRSIERTGARDRVCVASFSERRLGRLRRALGPEVCTAVGRGAVARLVLAARGLPSGPVPGACAQVPIRAGRLSVVTPRFVDTVHRRGLEVHVWTVDDAPTMAGLLDAGVDGIMTDRADVLRDVLRSRGQWPEP